MPRRDNDTFTQADLERACDDLAMVKFFPHESRAAVMVLLRKMCPHRTALKWLVNEVVNHVGAWPGPADLRGILCNRYDPADGIDQWCSLPGYTAADAEERHYEQHQQLTGKSAGFEKALPSSGAARGSDGGYVVDEARETLRELMRKLPTFGEKPS